MTQKNRLLTGLFVTAIFSLVVLSVFYGNLFDQLNRTCFASGGDGLQSYINMDYHIRYDTSYMRCNSMNYPYGEHVFFTNNQPFFSNTVKFISEHITDISGYTLGMLNFLMLFFLVITPVILYLIFKHFGVGTALSVIASVGITYLSPQLDRFGGHFNLSYVATIPWMILLLLYFFKKPTILLSALIFISVLIGAATHFYIYGFYALLILFFYGAELIKRQSFLKYSTLFIHFFIQLILPFLILQLFYISDHVTDRPSYPWGFLYYRAYPQSVFLPLNKPYGQFFHSFINTSYIDWEGYSIIGTMAFLGFLCFLFRFVQKLYRKEYALLWQVTNNPMLNTMYWASFAGLLYSFGIPFILGLEWLVDLIGPLRQMRGIARFAWVFYYIMNIVTIYWLWTWWQKENKKFVFLIMVLAVFILCVDARYNVRGRGKLLANTLPVFTDRELTLPENQWIRRINTENYQAFIPIPYFHIGSENLWIDGGCDIVNQSFAVIKNSGLPCMGVMLSRTSINQTIDNVSAITSPTCDNLDLNRYPSEKPFILLVAKCELRYSHEQELINHAHRIDSSGTFDLYELPFNAFRKIQDSLNNAISKEYETLDLFRHHDISSTDSLKNFIYFTFDSVETNPSVFGSGCLSGTAKDDIILYSGPLPSLDTSRSYILSFWMNDIRTDLYPRTTITIKETDSAGNQINRINYPVSKQIMQVSGNRALIGYRFRVTDNSNAIIIQAQNRILRKKKIMFDNLLIHPESNDIYFVDQKYIWKNNYYYCK